MLRHGKRRLSNMNGIPGETALRLLQDSKVIAVELGISRSAVCPGMPLTLDRHRFPYSPLSALLSPRRASTAQPGSNQPTLHTHTCPPRPSPHPKRIGNLRAAGHEPQAPAAPDPPPLLRVRRAAPDRPRPQADGPAAHHHRARGPRLHASTAAPPQHDGEAGVPRRAGLWVRGGGGGGQEGGRGGKGIGHG
jgi:hypothetical protein